jgi:hypothetical protein
MKTKIMSLLLAIIFSAGISAGTSNAGAADKARH